MHAKIHTAKAGILPAVFGWPAIHTRRAANSKEIKPNVDTVILDGGFSSKQEVLDKGINIGDIVNAVQEEVGLRGATMIAHRIRPNVALITDVCHCTDSPLYSKTREGETTNGNGPVLSTAPAVHPNVRKRLLAIVQTNTSTSSLPPHQGIQAPTPTAATASPLPYYLHPSNTCTPP